MTEKQEANRAVYAAVMVLIAFGVLASFTIWYVGHEQRQADQRWCELFVGLDDNYRSAPAGTLPERTRVFAAQIRALREELSCKETVVVPSPLPSLPQPTAVTPTPEQPTSRTPERG